MYLRNEAITLQTVLCFGDSNTYGLNPRDKSRFDYDTRWTGILDKKLQPYGFRTAEEGLCGRTTVFPDEVRSSRRGVDVFPFLLESHSPVAYVVLMLGTNDCKANFHASPEMIGNGIRRLIGQIRDAGDAKILLIAPIHLGEGVGEAGFDPDFDAASIVLSKKLKQTYAAIAAEEGCLFLAASDAANPSSADREHLDEIGHRALADAIFEILHQDFSE